MRVAMVQTAAGLKPPSGGFRGNYATLFALAKHGHTTMQFCWAFQKDINGAVAELKADNKLHEAQWTWGSTYMLNVNLEPVKVTFWKFLNVHGVLCVALDAEVMIPTYPNDIQQEDAAIWIEVSLHPAVLLPSLTYQDRYATRARKEICRLDTVPPQPIRTDPRHLQ